MRAGPEAAFAALPAPVRACLKAAGPGLKAAARKDPPGFAKELLGLLNSAAAALNSAPAEVLFLTGFDSCDGTPGRLDAALAELRAALFLRHEGFEDIRPVARAAGRTADLAASRGGREYLFEVRWVRGGFGAGAAARLSAKCEKKSAQLRAGLKRSGAELGGIIFVGEPLGFGKFRDSLELAAVAAAVTVPARRRGLHVCLVSGWDTAVSPPWSAA